MGVFPHLLIFVMMKNNVVNTGKSLTEHCASKVSIKHFVIDNELYNSSLTCILYNVYCMSVALILHHLLKCLQERLNPH